MKRLVEIIINILFWAISGYIIFTAISPKQIEIEEINGVRNVRYLFDRASVLSTLLGLGIKAGLYYFNVYFLSRYLFKNKIGVYLLALLSASVVAIGLETIKIALIFGLDFYDLESIMMQLGTYVFFVGISFVHIMILRWRKEEAIKQQLREENLTAELKLLKSQINPHFLFNALNNLMSIAVRNGQTEVSSGIEELSDMLRFLLYDMSAEKIPVSKEIEFIENYINLNELRFDKNDPIQISFNIRGDHKNLPVSPALFIPLVENAFKHGIDIYRPSFVTMALDISSEKRVSFSCTNSVHNTSEPGKNNKNNSGVGLQNVKRRLDILYPDRHHLYLANTDHQYEVKLTLEVSC